MKEIDEAIRAVIDGWPLRNAGVRGGMLYLDLTKPEAGISCEEMEAMVANLAEKFVVHHLSGYGIHKVSIG